MKDITIKIYSLFENGTNPQLYAQITESPLKGDIEYKNQILSKLNPTSLIKLRSKPAVSDHAGLTDIGNKIRDYLGQSIWTAVTSSRQVIGDEPLKIIFYVDPSAISVIDQNNIRSDEIPIELLWDKKDDFYSLNTKTPIVRGISPEPDKETLKITVPLKILVVISTPIDKPKASTEEEKKIIQTALGKHLADEFSGYGGDIWVKYCAPATKRNFKMMLSAFDPHVVHFIGHGGFGIVGEGQISQGYLSFQRENDNYTDPMHAEDLAVLLKNSSVKLLVTTACSSAQAAPINSTSSNTYDTFAFEGVAQKVVSGSSGLTAAVAMQFDMEEDAAIRFTEAFYQKLLEPNIPIENVLTLARIDIVSLKGVAHPSWISPVLFSRSTNGIIFELNYLLGDLTPQQQKLLEECDITRRTYTEFIKKIDEELAKTPVEIRGPLTATRDSILKSLREVESKRNEILGDSVRIRGESTKLDTQIVLPITVRVRGDRVFDRVELELEYPSTLFENPDITPGKDLPNGVIPTRAIVPGNPTDLMKISISIPTGAPMKINDNEYEYEIAEIRAKISNSTESGFKEISLKKIEVFNNNSIVINRGMSGVLYVHS